MAKSNGPGATSGTSPKNQDSSDMVREVTRNIPRPVEAMLWGRAAGRCEFDDCNVPLFRSSVTQESVNHAEKAHIYSFSELGARGHDGVSDDELNVHENLMLLCHRCHRTIDQKRDGGRYTPELLRGMKARHERRVEIVTGITPGRRSHVLLYGANVGKHNSPLSFNEAAAAMLMLLERNPAEPAAINLGSINSSFVDRDQEFWAVESVNLLTHFERRVREKVLDREIEHLSVFAIAPQPLLILLGVLLGDIVPADVYQRHREPPTWSWPTAPNVQPFEIREPEVKSGPPALVLGLSATVTPDRISAVLGPGASIWYVGVPEPHNELIKSREQLFRFRSILRPLLDRIKAAHGQNTLLHIFPAASVSVAVELGRLRMPKADTPWKIYDQSNQLGGFVHALDIPGGSSSLC
jgi:SMODS-associated and fused to various effectors sensor domain